MNSVQHATSAIFDLLLRPLDALGPEIALLIASGVFGIAALILFKYISYQRGIKRAKDLIKGHLIEIRIYQDDLWVVAKAIGKILLRNGQYLLYNFAPILPLAAPFTLVAAQLVVRYGFAPVPLSNAAPGKLLPGQGVTLDIELRPAQAARVSELRIDLPAGLVAISPLVRLPEEGRAFQELAATQAGGYEIALELPGAERATKRLVVGALAERSMQPERVGSFWSSWLWPAEDSFGSDSAFQHVSFQYPNRKLRWLPDGPGGVLLTFLLAAMAFGLLVMKPLGIQI